MVERMSRLGRNALFVTMCAWNFAILNSSTCFGFVHRSWTSRAVVGGSSVPLFRPLDEGATVVDRRDVFALRASPGAPWLSPRSKEELLVYLIKTLIRVSVPTLATVFVLAFVIGQQQQQQQGGAKKDHFGGGSSDEETLTEVLYGDLYGAGDTDRSGAAKGVLDALFSRARSSPALPRNAGVPARRYVSVSHLNEKLDSYRFSVEAAMESRAAAANRLRRTNFRRAVDRTLAEGLSAVQEAELTLAEKTFLKEGSLLLEELESTQRRSIDKTLDKHVTDLIASSTSVTMMEKKETTEQEDNESDNVIADASGKEKAKKKKKKPSFPSKVKRFFVDDPLDETAKINVKLAKLELNFMEDVMTILGPEKAEQVKTLWVGNVVDGSGLGGSLVRGLKERPLTTLLTSTHTGDSDGNSNESVRPNKKNLFVTNFPGDVTASQVAELREEVTAILRSCEPGRDEALLVLQSGGGTVTGYGLAAAQLKRFKERGVRLTVCVEQVAASGGYMMCCVADHVVASPFAVLGSIGVISDIPNAYERLKREGVEFQTITAGKYKRTVTPTKKPTKEDVDKAKEDLEDVLTLFKGFVHENRPGLDIEAVATGETWFGQDALDRNLCDEIRTKDDVLLDFVDDGYDVFEVKYDPPPRSDVGSLFTPLGSRNDGRTGGVLGWLAKSLVNAVRRELSAELSGRGGAPSGLGGGDVFKYGDCTSSTANRVMMLDDGDAANRIKFDT